jgi:hypothetical protein
VEPLPGPAVNDLGEVEKSRLSEFQQLLALQIALAACPIPPPPWPRDARRAWNPSCTMNFRGWLTSYLPATMRTRSAYKYSVAGMLMASRGIE